MYIIYVRPLWLAIRGCRPHLFVATSRASFPSVRWRSSPFIAVASRRNDSIHLRDQWRSLAHSCTVRDLRWSVNNQTHAEMAWREKTLTCTRSEIIAFE